MEKKYHVGLHMMWYEAELLPLWLNSFDHASSKTQADIRVSVCCNLQTYIESPIDLAKIDAFRDACSELSSRRNFSVVFKEVSDPFYNIGDWRREIYSEDVHYNIWGESDCLFPEQFFLVLDDIDIKEPHYLSFASRKMWGNDWRRVEHEAIADIPRDKIKNILLLHNTPINQKQLDTLNEQHLTRSNENPQIRKLHRTKLDGALTCLPPGLPYPFIPPDMHFAREDTCAMRFFRIKEIPQYLVSNVLKGHNYRHPLKRTNTDATRKDSTYKQYEKASQEAMDTFLHACQRKKNNAKK